MQTYLLNASMIFFLLRVRRQLMSDLSPRDSISKCGVRLSREQTVRGHVTEYETLIGCWTIWRHTDLGDPQILARVNFCLMNRWLEVVKILWIAHLLKQNKQYDFSWILDISYLVYTHFNKQCMSRRILSITQRHVWVSKQSSFSVWSYLEF